MSNYVQRQPFVVGTRFIKFNYVAINDYRLEIQFPLSPSSTAAARIKEFFNSCVTTQFSKIIFAQAFPVEKSQWKIIIIISIQYSSSSPK